MKKTPLKRSGKPIKRSPMRRISKRGKRQDELRADSLWKVAVFGKHGTRCVCCNKPAYTVHHIFRKAKGLYPKLRHVVENGMPVCQGCHFTIHMDSERGRDMVIKFMGEENYLRLKDQALLSKADSSKYDPRLAIIALEALKNEDEDNKRR